MNLQKGEYDLAFVKCMAEVTQVTNEATRKAFMRWSHIVERWFDTQPPRRTQVELSPLYTYKMENLFINKKLHRCLVITHEHNGQQLFLAVDWDKSFDVKPFFQGRIPRERQLDCCTFHISGQPAWLFDPKELFLEAGREGV
uniref:Uncharacterized protein n=1 Tax=Pseudomonas phage RVTF4 TaxID=3236931 RepID=A0AB39CCA6_9VIRU